MIHKKTENFEIPELEEMIKVIIYFGTLMLAISFKAAPLQVHARRDSENETLRCKLVDFI